MLHNDRQLHNQLHDMYVSEAGVIYKKEFCV